jgi:diadenosine tetraphosphate (Ap4A) HIT family hydrolase
MDLPFYDMKNNNENCPFCICTRDLITENDLAFAIYDLYPVNAGHALIIPKKHVADYFLLTIQEQVACMELLNEVKVIIEKKFMPNGYNVGINIHQAAGQTVAHVHVHLIPRYIGDVSEPRGGIRGVIPEKKNY